MGMSPEQLRAELRSPHDGKLEFRIVDPRTGAALPDPRLFSGVVITGSAAMFTDRAPWSERIRVWIPTVLDACTPLLGICYGHHLLAEALDGKVGRNPRGLEIGTVDVELTHTGIDDPLFAGFPKTLSVHTTHWESVIELPSGAELLARNEKDPHHAFAIGDSAWAVQFHPEFDADVMRRYIDARRESISKEDLRPEQLLEQVEDSPHGSMLLQRFGQIVKEKSKVEEG